MKLNKRYKTFVLLVLIFCVKISVSQNPITFVITSVPAYTPADDCIHLVSSLNNWNTTTPEHEFKLFPDGYYRLTIDIGDVKKFEYKINRGDWDKVEGNKWGDYLSNRRFTYSDSIYEVRLKVASWQDLHHDEYPPVKVVVLSVPENTPHDANIYLTGTFNNWMDNDPAYRLTKNSDGNYVGEIQAGIDTVAYKFTRGTWESIEARWDGGMRSNRIYIANRLNNHQIVAEIKSWKDLSGGVIGIRTIFLVLLIQCILVLALIIRFQKSMLLLALTITISLAFLLKYLYADYSVLYKLPYGIFITALLYTFIGPLTYSWLKARILKQKLKLNLIQLLPIIPVIWYLFYLKNSSHVFYLKVVNNEFVIFFFVVYMYGLLVHMILNLMLNRYISRQIADMPDLIYRFHKLVQTNLYISIFIVLAGILSLWQNAEIKFITDWVENLLWIGVGVVVFYFEWYFIINIYANYNKVKPKVHKENSGEDSWARLKSKLIELMVEKQVYTNPNLTLSDLAGYLGTNNHYVSKLINEGFRKSYTDYINSYRIDAFIDLMNNEENDKTFLSTAYKVGFNSKSAFNRAFKKEKNITPSEYFSQ